MKISMYQASVPTFILMLNNLSDILEKAAAYGEAKKIDPTVLINARLYPDMYPLVRQVQIATDNAKGSVARLAGEEPPKYEDNETSFAELIARIRKTVDYLAGFKREQIDGSEEKTVVLKFHHSSRSFAGLPYLLNYVFPTIYFHITTAYCILRHNGVELGKRDYLGNSG
ncbi:MAG: DUF1993 domain-containing protein [Gammaproteobacteria bacterium]